MDFHILNGDCLAKNFPAETEGEIIVWRETLVCGPLDREDFFVKRETFIEENFAEGNADYQNKVLKDFRRIIDIPANSKVYFWF